jgi:hypothetical protein
MAISRKQLDKSVVYSTPVYIHSHASALEKVLAYNDGTVRNKMKTIYDRNHQHLKDVVDLLKNMSSNEVVQNWYYSTHENNGKRIMDKTLANMINTVINYRNKAFEQSDARLKQFILDEFQHGTSTGLIIDKISEVLGPAIAEKVLTYTDKKRKDNTKIPDIRKVKVQDIAVGDEIYELLKKSIEYNLHGQELGTQMEEALADVQNYINAAVDLVNIDPDADANKLYYMALNRSKHGDAFARSTSSGILFEYLLYSYLKSAKVSKTAEGVQIDVESTGTGGHESTTDLDLILSQGEKSYRVGLSLKANMTTGKTSQTFAKQNVIGPALTIKSDEYNKMIYILANLKALSTWAAPDDYETVIESDGVDEPENKKIMVFMPDWVKELQQMYAMLALVKGLLGEILTRDNIDLNGELNPMPPLVLTFLEYDYWMWEILNNLLTLMDTNQEQLANFMSYLPFTFESSVFNVFQKDKLVELFVAKKQTECINENRYEDFLKSDLDDDLLLVTGISESVRSILTDFTKAFAWDTMRPLLFPNVNFSIPINQLLQK